MELNQKLLEALQKKYESISSTSIVFLTGEKGLGKSHVIQRFLDLKNDVINIYADIYSTYSLEPIVRGINSYYSSHTNSSLNSTFSERNGLDFLEKITYELIKICSCEKIILIFHNVSKYEITLLTYIKNLLQCLVNEHNKKCIFIILEIDTNNERELDFVNLRESLYSITEKSCFLTFHRIANEQLEEFFYSIFSNSITIDEEDLIYIISSSFGNIEYFIIIINYLKQSEVIYKLNGKVICKHIKKGFLSHVLKKYILSRYEKLDADLKKILCQSSIIGQNFNKNLLIRPFQIIEAEENLQKIEQISKLIFEKDQESYSFENFEVYNIINHKIPDHEKIELHGVLAKYYESLYERLEENIDLSSNNKKLHYIFKAAYNYEKNMSFDKSAFFYIKLMYVYNNILDYHNAIKTLERIKKVLPFISSNTSDIECILAIQEADIFYSLGRYDDALKKYKEIISKFCNILEFQKKCRIQLNLAYCHYMSESLKESLNIVLALKQKLYQIDHKSILYYQVLSFLASVYDLLGEYRKSQKYFVMSLAFCKKNNFPFEYYTQLKKASMVMDEELTQKMMDDAANYFREKNNIRELAEVKHNLATDALYLARPTRACENVNESIKLFNSFASKRVHYPLNTKGVCLAVFENDYQEALLLFQNALDYEVECFSQVTLNTNISMCFRKLGIFDSAVEHARKVDVLIKSQEKHVPFYQIYHCINWAHIFFDNNDIENFNIIITEFFSMPDLPNKHTFIIANLAVKFFNRKNMPIPVKIEEFANIKCQKIMQTFSDKEVFFATVRYWE